MVSIVSPGIPVKRRFKILFCFKTYFIIFAVRIVTFKTFFMNWTIEQGTLADAETIAFFQLAISLESEGVALNLVNVLKGVTAGLSDPRKGCYYLAKAEDGKTAGCLFLTKEWSDWNNSWYFWVQSVYVLPEYRHKGAFSALYATLKDIAKKEGASCMRLYVDKENLPALRCYKKQGLSECHYLMYEEKI